MNASTTYADTFYQAFAKQTEFLSFLERIDSSSRWVRQKVSDLRVIALAKDDPLTQTLRRQYAYSGQEGLIDDTMEHTRLLLKAQDELMPIRACAMKTILDRARIGGYALAQLDKRSLADVLNLCLQIASGNALLWYSDGKVSAVHGGDEHDYAVLEIPALFSHATAYLDAHYPGYTFAGGSYDHATVTALWELTGQDALVETYRQALGRHGLLRPEQSDVRAAVRLTTSNTGISGANLYPMLLVGSDARSVPLGSAVKEEHKGGADLDRFDANLDKLFAQFNIGLKTLAELLDIELAHPANAMQLVLKELGIPKRLSMEAVEQYRAQIGDSGDTAHGVYLAMTEILYNLQRDGATGTRIAAMEEDLARALRVKWASYDLPGELKW